MCFVLFFSVLCTLCRQFLWIVYLMSPVSPSCVPYVASFSGLWMFYCPCGIIWRWFGFNAPKNIKLFGFPIFRFWAYLTKVILSVPDEGYSERTWRRLFWAYPMKVILGVPDEGYSERTWWRLLWAYLMKVILSVPDEGYSERTLRRLFWAYLMKVILSVPDEGYSRTASFTLNFISTCLM